MRDFGINEEQINKVFDKYNIKSGEVINANNVRNAIAEILNTNNGELKRYLENEYPNVIARQLAMNQIGRR